MRASASRPGHPSNSEAVSPKPSGLTVKESAARTEPSELGNENGYVVWEIEVVGQDTKTYDVKVDAGDANVLAQQADDAEGSEQGEASESNEGPEGAEGSESKEAPETSEGGR